MVQTLNVLIVDDELGMRLGAARALKDFRVNLPDIPTDVVFETQLAASGEEAMEMIRASPPDLLLLDHKLPGISGLDVLDNLIAQKVPDFCGLVIMITAYASLETAVTAIKRGAYDFLAKPFTPSELKALVRKASQSLVLTRQARRLALEKRQVRFQFVTVLAHELKAPLSAIEGYLQIIKDRSAGEDPLAYDHMLDRSLIRLRSMRKLIEDLLDLTRIESGAKRRELVQLDLRDVAQACLDMFAVEAAARDVKLHLHHEGPVKILADRGEMEILLNNLVSNAVKYNRPGGKVDVTLGAAGDIITITVADTGIGMSEEEVARLFNDFVRIKNDQTRNILGSGLGLSIVKKVAQLYGGDATAVSTHGAGSIFTVTLNTREPQTPASESADHAPAAKVAPPG